MRSGNTSAIVLLLLQNRTINCHKLHHFEIFPFLVIVFVKISEVSGLWWNSLYFLFCSWISGLPEYPFYGRFYRGYSSVMLVERDSVRFKWFNKTITLLRSIAAVPKALVAMKNFATMICAFMSVGSANRWKFY